MTHLTFEQLKDLGARFLPKMIYDWRNYPKENEDRLRLMIAQACLPEGELETTLDGQHILYTGIQNPRWDPES